MRLPNLFAGLIAAALGLGLLAYAAPAQAAVCVANQQTGKQPLVDINGYAEVHVCLDDSGGGGGGGAVTISPNPASAINQVAVTCGTASTSMLAANAATVFITVSVPTTSAAIWVNWANVAAVSAPPSEQIAPGGSKTWLATVGVVPSAASFCIAASASPVTVEYK